MSLVDSCLFCKIIQGTVPCHKLIETAHSLAFMDVFPLSHGHVLVIPKIHGQFLHQIPDEHLHDCISTVKKIASATHPEGNYNFLQNNGRIAGQQIDHAHFHLIPRFGGDLEKGSGLVVQWNAQKGNDTELAQICAEIKSKLSNQ